MAIFIVSYWQSGITRTKIKRKRVCLTEFTENCSSQEKGRGSDQLWYSAVQQLNLSPPLPPLPRPWSSKAPGALPPLGCFRAQRRKDCNLPGPVSSPLSLSMSLYATADAAPNMFADQFRVASKWGDFKKKFYTSGDFEKLFGAEFYVLYNLVFVCFLNMKCSKLWNWIKKVSYFSLFRKCYERF